MATFNYTVDTNPMAAEINTVSSHVKGTTTAVVAMQTAVVLAEAKAANHVCDNVNKGFYTMMRSQISQKIAKLQSEVDSHLMKLNQLKKNLLAIQSRMQRDYNMTSARYLRLFNGLNANLKQRVFELDKSVISFAVKDVEQISNRTKYLTATIPITQLESLSASQKIIASNVKYRGLNVINSMKSFLNEMEEQKKLTNRILLENYSVENAKISLPVLICECNHDKYDNKSFEITVSNVELSSATKAAIKNTVFNNADNLSWQTTKEIDPEIKSEFSKLVLTSSSSQRVKDLTNKLFFTNNCLFTNDFQTVKTTEL
jgi:hypothetical protein